MDAQLKAENESLKTILAELIKSVEIKASALARPERYFSPRMEEAIAEAKKLLGQK